MTANVSGVGMPVMPNVMSGASMRAPPQQKMNNLFNKIDTSGTGSISQAQFTQAFDTLNPPGPFKAAGANAIWNQLNPSGSGQVSQSDFVSGMKSLMAQLRQGTSSGVQTAANATQTLDSLGNQTVNILV